MSAPKYEIYSIADGIAASGNGILFISSELEELMGLCDRILVMSHGEIQREFNGPISARKISCAPPSVRTWPHDPFPARALIGTCWLRHAADLLAVFIYFGLQSPAFVRRKASATSSSRRRSSGIAAVGIIFVLLTAGIDLSVGSVMYLAPLIAGFAMREFDLGVGSALASPSCRRILGAINAFLIVRLRIIPFIVTLATLFFFRGAAPS
jgi:energy-coupling factor transporter ATP-binding protein EcfA2